jgi:ATP-dependent Zn protease
LGRSLRSSKLVKNKGNPEREITKSVSDLSAYHESGHAFMALHVGARVHSMTVDPDWDDGPQRYADVQIEWPAGQFTEKEFHEKNVLISLAGPVAEMIHSGEPYHPAAVAEWSSDWKLAWESARTFLADEQKRLQYLEQVSVELYRLLSRDDYWQIIATLADHLVAHETLESDEILEIVQPWI